MSVYEYTDSIDLKKLVLYTPKSTQGGGYHAKIMLANDNLLIQTPKINIKNGFHKTGKRLYCDLLINREHLEFINFLKNIEKRVIDLVYNKGNDWFSSKPTHQDISERWNSMFKIYKNTNTLLRTLVEKDEKRVDLKVWNEEQKEISYEELNHDDDVICIFHISNIRFSSTSFQVDVILKQMMRFKKKTQDKCLIKGMSAAFVDINNKIDNLEDLEDNEESEESEYSETDYSDEDSEEDDEEYGEDDDEEEEEDDDEEEEEDDDEDDEEEQVLNETNNIIENNANQESSVDKLEDVDVKENVVNTSSDEKVNNIVKEDIEKNEVSVEIDKVKRTVIENNLEKNLKDLEEVNLNLDNSSLDTIQLKKPKDVYIGIYNKALAKARQAKKEALQEYLNAKNIKKQYLLDDVDSSDGEDLERFN